MDNKLLLVKSVTLLYRESLLTGNADSSVDLVRTVLESVKPGEVVMGLNKERETILALKTTLLDMCSNPPDHIYDANDLLQQIKMNIQEDDSLAEAFEKSISVDMQDSSLKRTILHLRKQLHDHFRDQSVEKMLNKASYSFRHERDKIKNVQNFLTELIHGLEPFQTSHNSKDPAVLADVDIGDEAGVTNVYKSIKDQDAGNLMLRTGWQGLNRATGGGLCYGEQWMLNAQEHQYKTGISLTLFKHLIIYNEPVLKDPTKKPLALRISFEDPLTLNFRFLYKNFYENENPGHVLSKEDLEAKDAEELTKYVQDRMKVNGWHVRFMFVNPGGWTIQQLFNKIIELEAEGYEIKIVMLDYLLKLPTTGCDKGAQGEDLRNMFERTKNFICQTKGALMITPHQLSTESKNLIRDDRANFVQLLPGNGYTAGSKQLEQVVDGSIYFHIERHNREAYLTAQRGKMRRIDQVDDEDKYFVLKFVKKGIIPDDLGKPDSTRRKVGGDIVGGKEEVPFWDLTGSPGSI